MVRVVGIRGIIKWRNFFIVRYKMRGCENTNSVQFVPV